MIGLSLYGLVLGRWMEMPGLNQVVWPRLRNFSQIHHSTSAAVVTPVVMTAAEKASAMTAWATEQMRS